MRVVEFAPCDDVLGQPLVHMPPRWHQGWLIARLHLLYVRATTRAVQAFSGKEHGEWAPSLQLRLYWWGRLLWARWSPR